MSWCDTDKGQSSCSPWPRGTTGNEPGLGDWQETLPLLTTAGLWTSLKTHEYDSPLSNRGSPGTVRDT